MKILLVNKFFYVSTGVESNFLKLSKLLEFHKQYVAVFSMENRKNFPTKWSKYFVSNISFGKVEWHNSFNIFARMFFSFETKRKISQLLKNFSPEVAHIRSINHHLSPSFLLELKKRNIPIIQTLGDYHVVAPNYFLYHDDSICEITKPNKFYKAILHKCVKSSYVASSACALEMYFHSWIGLYPQSIDYFISPSRFMRTKLIEYGLPKEKIIHLPHFIDYESYRMSRIKGDYILYFGRLSHEKGLKYLIQAMQLLPKVKLVVAGRGSEEVQLKALNSKLGNKNVQFIGFKEEKELKKCITNSRLTVLPSVCYENLPNSILESLASGKPVVASNIGGIPEIVKDGLNGFLFKPENSDDLVEKIDKLWNNNTLCKRMGENARGFVEKYSNPQKYYEQLIQIYKIAIAKHN